MTPKERTRPELLNAKRKIRVAKGSGTTVQDVNRLLKMHQEMATAMKKIRKMGGLGKLGALFGGGGGGWAAWAACGGMPGGGCRPGGLPGLAGRRRRRAVQPSARLRQVHEEIDVITQKGNEKWQLQSGFRAAARRSVPITRSSSPTRATRATASSSSGSAATIRCSPRTVAERVKLDTDRAKHWLSVGAQPSDRVARFLDAAGIMERAARNNPKKGEPGEKAKERAEERATREAEAAEAAAARRRPRKLPPRKLRPRKLRPRQLRPRPPPRKLRPRKLRPPRKLRAEEAPAEEAPAEEAPVEAAAEEAAADQATPADEAAEQGRIRPTSRPKAPRKPPRPRAREKAES